ncbi:MAG: aldehyde dehydrogenase family protein, partial [Bacilli bacterium]|nr:aldehyde dehydrogenase family protein [Bacilli bacterium]
MKKIFQAQKRLFERGLTQGYRFRKEKLLLLKTAIINNKQHLINALHQDLNKSETEAILTEIGPVLQEINFYLKHLKKWMQPQPVKTPFILKPGKSYRWFAPLGLNLIISPWNYPVNLTFIPLAAAVAAGNTAIVKVSSYSRHTGQIIAKIISEAFSS